MPRPTDTKELAIITVVYDFLLWTTGHIEKFPRVHRFSGGDRLSAKLHEILDLLIEAKLSHEKVDQLRRSALLAEQARFQFRVAKDLKLISLKSHRHACGQLEEISRQLGGWRRHVERRS